MTHSSTHTRPALAALAAAAALVAAFAGPAALAAEKAKAKSSGGSDAQYMKDRTDCENGRTAEDRATCMKEAGAALQERRRNGLTNSGSPVPNATDRCNALPAKDKADCMARVLGPTAPNQTVTTSGSVGGGGVIRETTTTIPGSVTVITPAPEPASAPRQ
jgi:hypothetical protein